MGLGSVSPMITTDPLYYRSRSVINLITNNIIWKYQSEELKGANPKIAGSLQLCATIFLPTKLSDWHTCTCTSLQLKTPNQNDWSVKNQMEYTGLRPGFIFRILLSCLNSQASENKLNTNYIYSNQSTYLYKAWKVKSHKYSNPCYHVERTKII